MPACSIVIPVHGKASLSRQCLDTLLERPSETTTFEVIVVDDASRDRTAELLRGYGARIRVIAHPTNLGFAHSCNDGAAAAAGEYLVFLNNDTVPEPGWLDALVRYATAHPRAGIVGSKLLFPDHTIQHAGVVIGRDRDPRHVYVGFPADHPAVNKSRRFQAVTGACLLIGRDLFARLGGFDTAYVNSYEDVDLCLRAAELGYEVHYCHESVLVHFESISREGRTAEEERNAEVYRKRWHPHVRVDEVDYYVEDDLLIVHPPELYPIKITVAPELGVVDGDDRRRRADRLLECRTRQVLELLKENIRLRVRLMEAELRAEGLGNGAPNGAAANGAAAGPPVPARADG